MVIKLWSVELISIVLPAKDEVGNIGHLMEEICQALQGLTEFEIFVVDDGSQDDTFGEVMRTAAEQQCDAKAIRHERSTAISTGVLHARGKYIVTLDADVQNDPADISAMLAQLQQINAEHFCIAGYRKNRKDTTWKRFQSRFANKVRDALLQDGVPDTGCGLKLFPRETFLRLPCFDHMHRYIPALVRRMGGEIFISVVNHRVVKWVSLSTRLGIVDIMGVIRLGRRAKVAKVARSESSWRG